MWRFRGKATFSWRRAGTLLSFDPGGAREGVLFTDGNGMSGTLSGLKSPDRPEVRNLWRVGETSGRRDRPFGRKEGARKKFSAEISRNPLKKLISRKEMESNGSFWKAFLGCRAGSGSVAGALLRGL